jgi:RNA polymerase sigma factor (sigma-70 family)
MHSNENPGGTPAFGPIAGARPFAPGEANRLVRQARSADGFDARKVGHTGRPAAVLAHIGAGAYVREAEQARHQLLACCDLYVFRVARRWANRGGFGIEDLVQEGRGGVLRALETYDPGRGFTFLTYADNWICQRMSRYTAPETGYAQIGSRVPQNIVDASARLSPKIKAHQERHGTLPTAAWLVAEDPKTSPFTAGTVLEIHSAQLVRLDAPRPEGETTLAGTLACPQPNPEEQTLRRASLRAAAKQLEGILDSRAAPSRVLSYMIDEARAGRRLPNRHELVGRLGLTYKQARLAVRELPALMDRHGLDAETVRELLAAA